MTALTFPLSQAQFFAGLPVSSCSFHLPASLAISRTRGGAVTTARLSERLWTGRIEIAPRRHADAAAIEAKISLLSEPGASFLAHPLPICGPISDPTGATLSGYSPVIYALPSGGREMRISGLPPGFVLTAGDLIGWTYGSSPTRYALHRLVTGATAGGVGGDAGITALFEVTPPIRSGVTTGTAVTLVKPPVRAILLPGQAAVSRPVVTTGLVLDFVQTLG